MGTTNGPTGFYVAAVAFGDADTNPCEKLEQANDDDRKRFANDDGLKNSKDDKARKGVTDISTPRDTAKRRVGHRNTITNSVLTQGGKKTHIKACSSARARKFDESFVEGLSTGEVNDKTSNMSECSPGMGYGTTSTQRPKQAHTESRIIETIMKDKPKKGGITGTLTMKIDWLGEELVDGKWKTTKKDFPCKHCEKVICAAKECGLIIELCNKAGQPEEPECKDGQFVPKTEAEEI